MLIAKVGSVKQARLFFVKGASVDAYTSTLALLIYDYPNACDIYC